MDRVSALIEQAKRATSLEDIGEPSFREGLERLVASADTQARLNEQGRALLDHQIVNLLSRRLEVEHTFALHPEIEEQEIVAPLIGLGLPRTGSTAFSCLLAEDPAVRSIRAWESSSPCPPPETATEHSDPRIAEQIRQMALTDSLAPRLKSMLPQSPTAPSECQFYMGQDFKSQLFQAEVRIPDYVNWLNHEADLVPTYQYVKRLLKLLQWHCPPHRWRLKNPSHIVFIEALDKVFPDARYWMTHRSIREVIPSVVDLYAEFSRSYTDDLDIRFIADMNMDWTEIGLKRVFAFRDRGNDSRFFDVDFATFQRDPFPVIAELYAFLGEPFTAEARARMEAWRRDTPRDKHGKHEVDPTALGIDIDALSKRFAFYDERLAHLHMAGARANASAN